MDIHTLRKLRLQKLGTLPSNQKLETVLNYLVAVQSQYLVASIVGWRDSNHNVE